ncbi:hypothetical protein LIER_34007 [Lithospermum erythrorhizon]|uniref:Uncharacterized protein n=1 Tax=Lithospermum erythrorhizon TaxID=34254 RepID=A0AAV3S0J7_LITER
MDYCSVSTSSIQDVINEALRILKDKRLEVISRKMNIDQLKDTYTLESDDSVMEMKRKFKRRTLNLMNNKKESYGYLDKDRIERSHPYEHSRMVVGPVSLEKTDVIIRDHTINSADATSSTGPGSSLLPYTINFNSCSFPFYNWFSNLVISNMDFGSCSKTTPTPL